MLRLDSSSFLLVKLDSFWQYEVKLNSRFEFPRKLDLSPFIPDAGRTMVVWQVVKSSMLLRRRRA